MASGVVVAESSTKDRPEHGVEDYGVAAYPNVGPIDPLLRPIVIVLFVPWSCFLCQHDHHRPDYVALTSIL